MKLKSILLLAVLSIVGLASCTSERLNESSPMETTSLTLVIGVEDTQTKAQTAAQTTATADEGKVNAVHVAVFDVTDIDPANEADAKRVAVFNAFTFAAGKTTVQLTGLATGSSEAKARKYLFYVIANSANSFGDLATYGAYQRHTITTNTFVANNLVKVGRATTSLYWGSADVSNLRSLPIDLIQLTARIDFKGIVNADPNAATTAPAFTLTAVRFANDTGINTQSRIAIYNTDVYENTVYTKGTPTVSTAQPFYLYETDKDKIQLEVTGNWGKGAKEYTYLLTLPSFIKGNRYEIRGTAIPGADIIPTIRWEVANLIDGGTVEIEFN